MDILSVTAAVIGNTQLAVKLAWVAAYKRVRPIAAAFEGDAMTAAFFTRTIPKE